MLLDVRDLKTYFYTAAGVVPADVTIQAQILDLMKISRAHMASPWC
jgi:hypothetical protein